MHTTYTESVAAVALTSATRPTGTASGTGIDLSQFGNNFREVTFVIITGTMTDGTHTVTIEESDTVGSGYAAVDSGRLLGTPPVMVAADDNTVFIFGCKPTKRFVRLTVVVASGATGGLYSAAMLLSNGSNGAAVRA